MLLEYLLIDWIFFKCAIQICILWSVKCSRDSIQIKADICYAFFLFIYTTTAFWRPKNFNVKTGFQSASFWKQ